jgi:hypothetical protein
MDDQTTTTCYILSLPNEILAPIFEYVIPLYTKSISNGFPPFSAEDHEGINEIFTLRSVCCTFRAIVNELPFWCDEKFDLLDLVSSRKFREKNNRWFRLVIGYSQGLFLETLLADKHLRERLSNRRTWRFSSQDELFFLTDLYFRPPFLAVLESMTFTDGVWDYFEVFKRHQPRVSFSTVYKDPPEGDFLDSGLPHLPRLQYLQISGDQRWVDMNSISLACPALTTIRLHGGIGFHGTLDGFSRLVRLDFRLPAWPRKIDPTILHPHLPLASANTLTRLSIALEVGPRAEIEGLDAFVNLTTFCISPLTSDICDCISKGTLQLVNFCAIITRDTPTPLDKISNMFYSPSLRNLEQLRFTIEVTFIVQPNPIAVMEAICSLSSLQHLVLALQFPWYWGNDNLFPPFRKLRSLIWHHPFSQPFWLRDSLYAGDMTKALDPELERALKKTFSFSGTEPLVEAWQLGFYQYARFWKMKGTNFVFNDWS